MQQNAEVEQRHQQGQPSEAPEDGEVTPYDEGDVSPWYGGDTGMGDPGSSLEEQEEKPGKTR